MPNETKQTPLTGTAWLEHIKKYEKYIPVMEEGERELYIMGLFSPSQKRIMELDSLLVERNESLSVIDAALSRQRNKNKF